MQEGAAHAQLGSPVKTSHETTRSEAAAALLPHFSPQLSPELLSLPQAAEPITGQSQGEGRDRQDLSPARNHSTSVLQSPGWTGTDPGVPAPTTRPHAQHRDAPAGVCPGSIVPPPQTTDQSCTSAQLCFPSITQIYSIYFSPPSPL